MFPFICIENIEHLCSDCFHVERGRVRAVGFINPCYEFDKGSIQSWGIGYEKGFIQLIPKVNGVYKSENLKGDGYANRVETKTTMLHELNFKDKAFGQNYSFWDANNGREFYHLFFKTEDAVYFVNKPVLIQANFDTTDDVGALIEWNVNVKWKDYNHPIIDRAIDTEELFYCFNSLNVDDMKCGCQVESITKSEIDTLAGSGNLITNTQYWVSDLTSIAFATANNTYELNAFKKHYITTTASSYTIVYDANFKKMYGRVPLIQVVSADDANSFIDCSITMDDPDNPNNIVIEHNDSKTMTIIVG